MSNKHSIPEPWRSFLDALDLSIDTQVELHCLGGFVVTNLYGLGRSTADIDFLWVTPSDYRDLLLQSGGEGSTLHKKYGVYLQYVTVADVPENYQERLRPMYEGALKHIQLFALDPYDLCLSKLNRNIERDREDVKHLARSMQLDPVVLRKRYEMEMLTVGIAASKRVQSQLEMWMEMIEEITQG